MGDLTNFKKYHYDPSIPAAAIFSGVFGVVSIIMLFQFAQALRNSPKEDRKKVRSLIPFLIGCLLETFGFIARIVSAQDWDNLGAYIVQSLFVLLAPVFFAATIYMTLGRIVVILEAQKYSFIPVRFLTKIFVTADILSFLLQGSGGGLLASNKLSLIDLGEKLIMIGLFVQIAFFGFFLLMLVFFQLRIRRTPTTTASMTRTLPSSLRNWNGILVTLTICSILILVRSVVRAIEYLQGYDGYIISHEIYLYLLDALLMFITTVLFALQDLAGYYAKYRQLFEKIGGVGLGKESNGSEIESAKYSV